MSEWYESPLFLGGLLKKQKDPQQISNVNLQDLSEFPTGKTLESRILGALQRGENIGFPQGYEERATSPFIASREAGWSERELPFLSEQYGGRGLGRSTIAARDIGKAYATKERDINEVIANAYLNNLTQKKTDIARYENLGYGFSGSQADTQNREALANSGIEMQNIAAQQGVDNANAQIMPAAISTGLQTFGNIYSAGQSDRLLDALEKGIGKNSASEASPFTSKNSNNAYNWSQPYQASSRRTNTYPWAEGYA